MNKIAKKMTDESTPMDMTPMIDIVFQLLIFFVLNIKFKSLEAKLDTFLPKDRGLQTFVTKEQHQDINVKVARRGTSSFVVISGAQMGELPMGWTKLDQDIPAAKARRKDTFQKVYAKLNGLHKADKESPVLVTVDPKVPHGDVVGIVNESIRANITNITFAGAVPGLTK